MLKSPFPWFGGKSRVAPLVWERFGDVGNYIEPFFGSGAMLLGRPETHEGGTETINDLDGYVANFWRAVQRAPEVVARWADQPVNENDLHARHAWLVGRKAALVTRLEGDPGFFDAQIAGWWVWGICSWIGGGWCSGKGPWYVEGGKLVRGTSGQGVSRQLPHLGKSGQGVNRQLPHLSFGRGVHRSNVGLFGWFDALAARLRRVRVCCGGWERVCGPSVLGVRYPAGIFLDPPYADTATRCPDIYAEDSLTVAHAVRAWAIEHGEDPKIRIALCGYDGEHVMPASWDCVAWKARGGYGSRNKSNTDNKRERIWFSPGCLPAPQKLSHGALF